MSARPKPCFHFFRWIWMLALLLCGTPLFAASDLRVSANGHYIEKNDGTPFFLLSDTEWLLNTHSDAQVLQILDDRKAKVKFRDHSDDASARIRSRT